MKVTIPQGTLERANPHMENVVSETPVVGSESTPAEPVKKTYKVKVDGQELEVGEDEVVKNYQLRKASDERFRKAAELEKAARAREEKLKQDPWSVLKELGLDPDEAAEQRLLKKLEWEMMSPEQRRLRELEAERNKLDSELKSERERKLNEQKEQFRTQAAQEIDDEIFAAIQEAGVSKVTPRLIARVAEELLVAYEGQKQKIPAKEALLRAKKNIHGDVKSLLAELPLETLVKDFLPPEFLKSLREFDLAQFKAQKTPPAQSKPSAVQKTETTTAKKKQSIDDFFDKL